MNPAMSVKQLPGLGPADCAPWIAALAKVQYRGYVNPFLHDQPPPDQTARAGRVARLPEGMQP